MTAVSRWSEFSVSSTTTVSAGSNACVGKRAGIKGNTNYPGDSFSIVANSNDQLAININGTGATTITLASGTNLDPRYVARDITYKLHSAGKTGAFCEWRNNKFYIWSNTLDHSTNSSSVTLASPGGRDAATTLGMSSPTQIPATSTPTNRGYYLDNANSYAGTCTVSGTYTGQFDDVYTVICSDTALVSNGTASGTNTYTGTFTTGGHWNGADNYRYSSACAYTGDDSYTITVSTASGTLMNGGTGNVPSITWTSTDGDNSTYALELLYADHWYDIGTRGLRCKWSDAAFGSGDSFVVDCTAASTGGGAVATAKVIWSSLNGDDDTTGTTTSTTSTTIGTKGVRMAWSSGTLGAGDEFRVICVAPRPSNTNLTNLNFGNVTVSTTSSVKAFWFELISGAYTMSTVKFGLQSAGSFSYHGSGTSFRFGTVGAGQPASDGTEWRTGVTATDLSSDTPPAYLYSTEDNLSVVADADSSESIGNVNSALVSDFLFAAITLAAGETGSNSTINYRVYFDYS